VGVVGKVGAAGGRVGVPQRKGVRVSGTKAPQKEAEEEHAEEHEAEHIEEHVEESQEVCLRVCVLEGLLSILRLYRMELPQARR